MGIASLELSILPIVKHQAPLSYQLVFSNIVLMHDYIPLFSQNQFIVKLSKIIAQNERINKFPNSKALGEVFNLNKCDALAISKCLMYVTNVLKTAGLLIKWSAYYNITCII